MREKMKISGNLSQAMEELAFDLTPDVREGRTSRIHPDRMRPERRTGGKRSSNRDNAGEKD